MPGQLIDVNGHRVHLYCTGDGAPTVVVAGGSFSFDWALVQPQVARFTRICTYDPTGVAWSDPLPADTIPTCADRINELHALLSTAAIKSPYVLVGFSIGGLIARLYEARYPTEVSGLVIVDHAFIDTGARSKQPEQPKFEGADTPPVPIYTPPVSLDIEDEDNFRKLPRIDQERHRWALSIGSFRPTSETAAHCFQEVAAAQPNTPYPLGQKPLAVVSTLYDSARYRDLQNQLLALSRDSKQYVAANSTHMVDIDEPEIIVAAIKDVVDRVRAKR